MKAPRLGRWAIGFGSGLPLLAAGVAVFALWVEDRFPSEDDDHALAPAVQRALTAPIADAINHQVELIVRRRAHVLEQDSGVTIEEAIARFLDDSVDLSRRRHLAYRLAALGSPQCIAALRTVLATAAPEHRAFMAQLIGSTGNAAARERERRADREGAGQLQGDS